MNKGEGEDLSPHHINDTREKYGAKYTEQSNCTDFDADDNANIAEACPEIER